MFPRLVAGIAKIHPFAPVKQTRGYQNFLSNLNPGSRKSPLAGIRFSQRRFAGQYAGLLVHPRISRMHNEPPPGRCVLIPTSRARHESRHAVMAGMKVVAVVMRCERQH